MIALALPSAAQDAPRGSLFPRPFVVEHAIYERGSGGHEAVLPGVTDYYGGAWLVSVRPDKSRLVVDFDRREITEVRPAGATYTVVSFDRLADLRRRLAAMQPRATATTSDAKSGRPAGVTNSPSLVVKDITGAGSPAAQTVTRANVPWVRSGVRHLRVTAHGGSSNEASVEVWLDPAVGLSAVARSAIVRLEGEVLGNGTATDDAGTARMIAEARERTGAFPVRTVRIASSPSGGALGATVEDVASRLEYVRQFPIELLKIPSGYRRIAHPFEVMVAYLEEEAARDRAMRAPAVK